MRGIQYAAAFEESRRLRLLGHPPSRMMTSNFFQAGAAFLTAI